MAQRATVLLASDTRLLLTDLVLAECVYVLESYYEVARDRVAELMRSAIALPSVDTLDSSSLLRALEVYEVDRLDFAEAYLVAQADVTGVNAVASFDRSIDRVERSRASSRDAEVELRGVDLELKGRRAIVTGGSRGIGLATARALVGRGARVAVVGPRRGGARRRGAGRRRARRAGGHGERRVGGRDGRARSPTRSAASTSSSTPPRRPTRAASGEETSRRT